MAYRNIENYNPTSDAEQRLNNARQQLAPEYWRDEETTAIVPKRTNNFVAPDPKPTVVRRTASSIDINMPQQSVMSVDMRTCAVDRAQGFSIETHQLSVVAGVLAVAIAVIGKGHPFFALGTLWTFFVWYSLVWLVAWLFHRVISPEGVAAFNAIMSWVYIFRRG